MTNPTSESRATLAEALTKWLEAERVAMADNLAKKGVSAVKTVDRLLAHRQYERVGEREGRWAVTFEQKKVEVSELSFGTGLPIRLEFTMDPPGELFVSTYGEAHLEKALPRGAAPEEKLLARLARFLALLCGAYFGRLRSVASPEPGVAESTVAEYLAYCEVDQIFEVLQMPMGGIRPPPIPVEMADLGVMVRTLSPEELGELNHGWSLATALEHTALPSTMTMLHRSQISLESCMLTVRTLRPKHDNHEPSTRGARIVVALQLLEYPLSGRGYCAGWTEPGPREALFPAAISMPQMPKGHEMEISEEVLTRIALLADRIPDACFDNPRSRPELAIRRFTIATAQDDDAEAVIDYVIALEALLVPGAQSEVSYRFCVHGARYLGGEKGDRQTIFANLKTLYGIRSRLAHGAGAAASDDMGDLRTKARCLAARGLTKALLSTWPTADDFIASALA